MADNSSTEPNPVTWQVAWWALVPLALSAMAQPCGRVLDRDSRNYRFYARASPILCIADVAYFLFLLLVGYVADPFRARSHARYELRRRFAGESIARDYESAESSVFVRLFILTLGSMPCQTVKLVAMQGIPWTKAWALMYFISLVFGEVIIYCAQSMDWTDPLPEPKWRHHWNLSAERSHPLLGPPGTETSPLMPETRDVLAFVSKTPLLLHFALCFWTLLEIVSPWFWLNSEAGTTASSFTCGKFAQATLIIATFAAAEFFWIEETESSHEGKEDQKKVSFMKDTVPAFLNHLILVAAFTTADLTTKFDNSLWPALRFTFFFSLPNAASMLVSVCWSVVRWPFIARSLRVEDYTGAQAMVVFLFTFHLSIFYYSTTFSSANTRNPDWTAVFG